MKRTNWYLKLRYGKIEGIRFDIKIGLRFLKLALLSAYGKVTIIETEEVFSKGGFKYKVFVVSKLPVSSDHEYTNV